MREIAVGVVAPAYVNVPLWVAQRRGFLEYRGLRATERICGTTHGVTNALRDGEVDIALTAPEGSIAEAEWFRGHVEESAVIAAERTSIEPRFALRACRALAADGVVPRDLRSGPGALAAVIGALRSCALIPPALPSGAGPDPIAAVGYSYL